jgi:serine/threonine protein kinase
MPLSAFQGPIIQFYLPKYSLQFSRWSVGVTIFELLVGDTPFYAESLSQTYSRIMDHNRQLRFPKDVKMSEPAKDIIRKFLTEANQRLGRGGLAAVKTHPFFSNSEWTFDNIRNS